MSGDHRTNKPEPNDLVGADERVLRRIVRHWFPDESNPGQPQFIAFRPRKPNKRRAGDKGDVDGLSVTREAITSAGDAAGLTHHVARLRMDQLSPLGLTVKPEPIPDVDPGHALIPELNIREYDDKKTWMDETAQKLADICEMVLLQSGEG